MLSARNKLVVINVLDSALGVGTSMKGNEQAHHCPFCHHHKKKLQVNLDSQYWHCWVCDSKGRSIQSLLYKLNVDKSELAKIHSIYGEYKPKRNEVEVEKIVLRLPKEFKSLSKKPKSINPIYNQAIHYLKQRSISMDEVLKYNIGYCEEGLYSGRIIIPSYNEDGELNYFIARSFYEDEKMKYPWFAPKMQVFESGAVQDMCGEDVSFCLDAIEAGYEIWCDPRIRVGHEKTRVI